MKQSRPTFHLLLLLLVLFTCFVLAFVRLLPVLSVDSKFYLQPIAALVSTNTSVVTTTYLPWPRHVFAFNMGGLGNQMFIYASLLGVATMNNMTPVYVSTISAALAETFEFDGLIALKNIRGFRITPSDVDVITEFSQWLYDDRFERLNELRKFDVSISSYLQSWKYFRQIPSTVRRAFTLRRKHVDAVQKFLSESSDGMRRKRRKPIFVGVHIRRTDLRVLGSDDDDAVYRNYLRKAVTVIIDKISTTAVGDDYYVVFVVCSDDQSWARSNFQQIVNNVTGSASGNDRKFRYGFNSTTSVGEPDVVHSFGRSASEDMAMLAACNHTIITVGSYGWWGAWLAGGLTVAFEKFPPFSNKLFVNTKDYYPPDWILVS